jgi:hypothetical protein
MAILSSIAHATRETVWPGITRRWIATWGLAFLLCGPAMDALSATPAPSREYQIKAVFLYNFVQFVEWPDTAFTNAAEPLKIGVLGEDPFGAALDEAVRGETVRSRGLVVKRAQRLAELADCQLVFFAKEEAWQVSAHLDKVSERPLLTVGDTPDFARRGGVIAFYSEGKKIRFELNVGLARKLGLKISSELLELGKIVGKEPASGGT